jgi:plasmid stabilization system protein ParE
MAIRLRPQAEQEISDAREWYEERSPERAIAFEGAVGDVLAGC